MVFRKGRKGGKGRKPRQYKSKISKFRRFNEPEKASLTETFTMNLNANQIYSDYNTTLLQYARATAVAKGYQMFRIKKISYSLKPQADTFVPNGNNLVPYLYYMIDRTASLSNFSSADQLRSVGAKPRRVDDKIITWSYRPSVLNASLDNQPSGTAVFQSYKISPWLPCNKNNYQPGIWEPNETDHLGCIWVVDQVNNAGAVTYELDFTVEFEFRKPMIVVPLPSEGVITAIDVSTLRDGEHP